MPQPKQWKFEDELVRDLIAIWRKRVKVRKPIRRVWPEVVHDSVGANTFRGLHGGKPSGIFRDWATLKEQDFRKLQEVRGQLHYDSCLIRIAADLNLNWPRTPTLGIGAQYKLVNLLAKVYCETLPDERWRSLIRFLHVPIDEYVLTAVHLITHDSRIGRIPANRGMSFVKTETQYFALQENFRRFAENVGCPAIALDYLTWNGLH
jgi:hypothetical protein